MSNQIISMYEMEQLEAILSPQKFKIRTAGGGRREPAPKGGLSFFSEHYIAL